MLVPTQVLIIVVVLSMALTPGLAELGKVAGDALDKYFPVSPAGSASSAGRAASEAREEAEMLKKRVRPMAKCIRLCVRAYKVQILSKCIKKMGEAHGKLHVCVKNG